MGLPILGVICIILFILYLIKVLKNGPYITNFSKGDSSRVHVIKINKANLVTKFGKAILSQFNPSNINIKMGDTVKFINNDVLRHTVEIANENLPNSNILQPGDEFNVTINQEDDIPFRSSLYKDMNRGLIEIIPRKKGSDFIKQSILGKYLLTSSTPTNTEGTNTEGTNTEGTNTEGTNTEGTNTEGTQPQKESKILLIKNFTTSLISRIKNIFEMIFNLGNLFITQFTNLSDTISLCNKKGIKECLKYDTAKSSFKFLVVIISITISILIIYKFVFNPKIYIPIYSDTTNLPQ
jgi:plastocyanin